jgi:hypothetical protein
LIGNRLGWQFLNEQIGVLDMLLQVENAGLIGNLHSLHFLQQLITAVSQMSPVFV